MFYIYYEEENPIAFPDQGIEEFDSRDEAMLTAAGYENDGYLTTIVEGTEVFINDEDRKAFIKLREEVLKQQQITREKIGKEREEREKAKRKEQWEELNAEFSS